MQLLEHEAKQLLKEVGGVLLPRSGRATSPEQAAHEASRLGPQVVVKAQVPTGGRGKGGGIQMVPSAEAGDCAARLLRSTVCGFEVDEVLVEEMIVAEREIYLAVVLSAATRSAALLVSSQGGVDVEAHPDSVAAVPVPALVGLQDFHVWRAAHAAGLCPEDVPALIRTARAVYQLFHHVEASLVEVNPLIRTATGDFVAADVRVVPSDAGAYCRANTPLPVSIGDLARVLEFDLVELDPDGYVGLLSTGAGASMLVVDLLSEAGARPINFCDFRSGRASGASERLELVLDYLRDRPALRCLAINFFAGITDLVPFATLLASTLRVRALPVPIVVRLEGTGAEHARRELERIGAVVVDGLQDLVDEAARATHTEGYGS